MTFIINVPKPVLELCKYLDYNNVPSFLVGGYVRDSLMGIESKDIDIEVYNVPNYNHLKVLLSTKYSVYEIGAFFGICQIRLDDFTIDIALPRTETKVSSLHTGFDVVLNSKLSIKEASLRRDFTINSMAYDPIKFELHDPHDGISDLKNKTIRHVSYKFSEDPLRVFRAMQFAARFNFVIHDDTISICHTMDVSSLSKERIFDEFKKCLTLSKKPSIGFNYLKKLKLLHLFPELEALDQCVQDPEWHPEGSVWTHTLMVLDEMASMLPTINQEDHLMFMLAALCHDFGKPSTTIYLDGHWRSPNHEKMGVEPTKSFIKRLSSDKKLLHSIIPLVEHHLKPALLYKADKLDGVTDSAIRRLSTKVNIQQLLLLSQADHFGRLTLDAIKREYPAGRWLANRASQLNVIDRSPSPLVKGKDLINKGVEPGPELGNLLSILYQAQLDDQFSSKEEALDYFDSLDL